MNPFGSQPTMPRREFLSQFGLGFGSLALADLMRGDGYAAAADVGEQPVLDRLHFPGRAKRIIFLFQAGGPSQLDLFDYKPTLNRLHGSELPAEVRMGQRLTGMSGNQSRLPLVGSPFRFQQHGASGAWVSELLPNIASIADDVCFIRSIHSEAINHGPAVTYVQTGSQLPGRPSIGAWLNYGLGSESSDLPAFVVMVSKGVSGQPLASRLWGSGFLPSVHQGVQFRSGADPVLYVNSPPGMTSDSRRKMLDTLGALHRDDLLQAPDPQIETRISQYELAFRMQTAIPEATNLADESDQLLDEYGPDSRTPGSFAANCILARRLAERGVRYIQLFHPGWDHHGSLPASLPKKCQEVDQPSAALIRDLKRRGLLDDTLVVWGGEFGRTNYCQGKLVGNDFGRDHHPRCFTMWMAGGGVKPGTSYGLTDEYGYNVAEQPMHIHDLQATMLYLMGIDHEQLTFKYQGRRFRLTDVHGNIIRDIVS